MKIDDIGVRGSIPTDQGRAKSQAADPARSKPFPCVAPLVLALAMVAAQPTLAQNAELKSQDSENTGEEGASQPAPAADDISRLDAQLGYKGWATPFPSFGDTLTQDAGGFRTKLAEHGIGITAFTTTIIQANLLDTPSRVPLSYPACTSPLGGTCAGSQAYFGQKPSYKNNVAVYLTYDLGRHGLEGGQLAASLIYQQSNNRSYGVSAAKVDTLSWYQPLFDKKLELKIGWLSSINEMVGLSIGGSYANPFGPTASVPSELGMSSTPAAIPAVNLKWHITDKLYNQLLVQRSEPMRGPTGNFVYDEVRDSNGIWPRFNSSYDGVGTLYANEFGFKQAPGPTAASTWIRAGVMHNTSEFNDLSALASGGIVSGTTGYYLLADRQLWQQDASSVFTAYRGIYAGFSAMTAPEKIAPFSRHYEARVYWLGPIASRPKDMISLNVDYNKVSGHFSEFVGSTSAQTGIHAQKGATTVVAVYNLSLRPGAYVSLGLSYTDHPSISYFQGEGESLNAVGSLILFF